MIKKITWKVWVIILTVSLILIGIGIYYKSTNWERIKHKEELNRIERWKEKISLRPLERLTKGTKFILKSEIVIMPKSHYYDISNRTDLMINLRFPISNKKRTLNKGSEFTIIDKKVTNCSHYFSSLGETANEKQISKCLVFYLDSGFTLEVGIYNWKKEKWLVGDIDEFIEVIHPLTVVRNQKK